MPIRRRDLLAAGVGLSAWRRRAQAAIAAPRGRLRAIHTMVDMPDWAADPGRHFDPGRYLRLCREAGVEVIEFKAKNAVGDAMFPFRERVCPRDWVTETRALAREAGIEFIAYYNVGLDNRMALRHPEWCCADPQGKPKIAFGAYNWMCLRSPWRRQVLDELRQMTEALRPEGVWFDLLGAPNAYGVGSYDPGQACFCRHCTAAYKTKFGEEQPVASQDPAMRMRANRFGHEARIAMLRDATDLLRSIDGKIELGHNGAGVYDDLGGTPPSLRQRITYNSSEAKQHRLISFTAKTLWSLGKAYQVHTYGGFMRMEPGSVGGTWAAWNLIPAPYLKVTAAIISAHAGRLGLGVNPRPDGTVYDAEFQNVGRVFAEIGEREQWLAGLESVPNVALVYDPASELTLLPLPETKGQPVRQETIGLHDALLDAGMHFDVVQAPQLQPERYRAVVLGNAVCPDAGLRESLARFVRGGGLLIATHETSLREQTGARRQDFAWAELLGVHFAGVSPYGEANYAWVGDELRGDAPAYPLLFRAPVLEVTCAAAKKLAELVYPEGHRGPNTFTDGETPYTHFQRFTGKPMVTINRLGEGAVIYITAPIGSEIAARRDPRLKRLLARSIALYARSLAIEVEAPPGIQAVYGRKPGVSVVSLVNYYAGLATGTEDRVMPEVGPVRLILRTDRPRSVKFTGGSGMESAYRDGSLEVRIRSVGHHALLILT